MRGLSVALVFLISVLLQEVPHAEAAAAAGIAPSVAFYYGSDLPASALSHFDHVVVQADQADAEGVALLRRRGCTVLAYVSLSEVARSQLAGRERFRLGDNPEWSTAIMDATQAGWQKALIEESFKPLWERGYRAFFLDNLDSYQRAVQAPEARAAQVRGLAQIIRELHARFPGIKLIFNRGFELLPTVAPLAAGLVAESLFRSWDPAKKEYVEVRESDRAWLLKELRTARDRYHLPVTVVDYVPPADRALARATARRIAALDLTPWVSEPALTTLGVGTVEVVPRRILAVYNGAEQRDRGAYVDVAYTPVHMMAASVLEHLGYAVDYADVREALPKGPLTDRYAGIVTWFTDDRVRTQSGYREWLLAQIGAGMKVAILDHLGFFPDAAVQKQLGIAREDRPFRGEVKLVHADPGVTGFETKVKARQNVFYPLKAEGSELQRLLSVQLADGSARMDAVFTAPWGGMAANPYVLAEGQGSSYRWIIDPFAFFRRALRLPGLPAADVTTQDGRRMLTVHIDGDGFPCRAEMPGNAYCGQVILDQILKKYPIKATVSIIEGEIGPSGKWPKLSPELEAIAREIFAQPNVEVASHSYSHPFDILRFPQDQEDGDINGMFRYDASLKREVDGSVSYINSRLAPRDKPTKVFLWPGEAIAPEEALALTDAAGLYNMNGGNTVISSRSPTLTTVSPMGRPVGRRYQTYAPIQNENVYTNLWRGPYYGFRDVISTFKLTDGPRRLKPISLYFHFYSGQKVGSLKVLQQAFRWALAQDAVPVYGSEYIRKVKDFQRLSLARRPDGCWQLRGDGSLTTLRLDAGTGLGAVDSKRSRGVTSVRELPQGRYVSLDGSGQAVLCLRPAGTSLATAAP